MNTQFLKALVRLKDKWVRLILIDDSVPDGSSEYQILPRQLFLGLAGLLTLVVTFFMLTLMFTPLGEWVYRSKESTINKQIDLGPVISHNVTKIYNDDTLFRFARRHYNCEIDMLVNFDKYIFTNKFNIFILLKNTF